MNKNRFIGDKFVTFVFGKTECIASFYTQDCEPNSTPIETVTLTVAQGQELLKPLHQRQFMREILPNHSAGIRELFITGLTNAEWSDMFSKEEKE
jgi:hypothetical protein